MPVFINTNTGEYPRFPGDVALDPLAPWATVEETPAPSVEERQVVTEGMPELRDGVYYQTWVVTSFTEEEWQERRKQTALARLGSLGITIEDLKALLA